VQFGFHLYLLAEHGKRNRTVANLKPALWVGNAVVLPFALQSGIARGFSLLDTPKEGLKSQFHADGDVLQNLAVNGFKFGVVFLPARDSRSLSVIGRRLQALLMESSPFMHKAVIDQSADGQRFVQRAFLRLAGVQPELIANDTHREIIPEICLKYSQKENVLGTSS